MTNLVLCQLDQKQINQKLMFMKKIGMLDLLKEIISMVLDVMNYAKGSNSKDDSNGNSN